MRVCVIGGGKVGFYLAQTLLNHGHTPVVVEVDEAACRRVANSLDIMVIHGDGTTLSAMESAQMGKCQVLAAVSGQDENNLIACQLAKTVFGVKKTVARVNNPRNAAVLRTLGVDIAVSATDTLARLIEREVETAAIQQVMSMGRDTSLSQVLIPEKFHLEGQTLAQIEFPPDCIVISIMRGEEMIIPNGATTLQSGDKVMLLAKDVQFHELATRWHLVDKK